MTDAHPHELKFLGRLVIVLACTLVVVGVLWHGVSWAVLERLWNNLVDRPNAPMRFRFILQPAMAAVAAIRDGLKDARAGRSPYLAAVLWRPQERMERLREGLNATARIILLGLAMDVIYQVLVLQTFHPNEAVIIALLLAFVPYLIIRGLVLRVWRSRVSADEGVEGADVNSQQEAPGVAESGIAPGEARFAVRVTADSHFAWVRTRAAVERTMLAWIRTAVALIGFGFTIVQFFVRMQDIPGAKPALHPAAPQYLGLGLISCGILALVISIWQFRWTIRYLWSGPYTPLAGMTKEGLHTPVVAVAVLLILVGLFAFFAVLLRLV